MITRRWFILGSAAAVAATQIALPSSLAAQEGARYASLSGKHARDIYELMFSPNAGDDRAYRLDVSRNDAAVGSLYSITISGRGLMMWRAPDAAEWWHVPATGTLRIAVTPDPGSKSYLHLVYKANNAHWGEAVSWPRGRPKTTLSRMSA